MLEIRRILFPTDFSESAQGALPVAVRLAEKHGSELHLLHVTGSFLDEPAEVPTPFPGEVEARETLEADGARSDGPRVIHHVIHNPAAGTAILECARDRVVDLIVLGSHGRRGFQLWNMGSVAEEVLRFARRPVLVVRQGTDVTPSEEIGRILVPIDFSDATPGLLDHATELALTMGSSLELLHVIEMPLYPDFYVATLALPENRRAALDRLKRLAEDIEGRVDVDVNVIHGRVAPEIADYAEEHGHGLILMASHGLTGVRRVLLGSATEGVARRAPCPVFVLKAEGKELLSEALTTADASAKKEQR